MLVAAGKWASGAYEFAILLTIAALGSGGGPLWIVPIAAAALLTLGLSEHADIRLRLARLSATIAASYATLALAGISLALASLSYVGGWMLAALIHA